ncbi:MAG: ATP-binding protein [Cetobacterium sp.]
MARKLLVIGGSGTGKSTSLRTLVPGETAIIKCVNKELPFKKGDTTFKSMMCTDAETIIRTITSILQKAPHIKNIVIDDLIYLSVKTFMDRSKEKGYEKFTDIANDLYRVITIPDLISNRPDLTFIYLTHSETNSQTLETNVRSIGKAIAEKVVVEGLFTVVLESMVSNGEYLFKTHNTSGNSVVKTPLDMFKEDEIPNDMSLVLKAMKEYY